jgi:hypothetical protein
MPFLTTTMHFEVIDEHFKKGLNSLLVDVKLESVTFNQVQLDRELKDFCESFNLIST